MTAVSAINRYMNIMALGLRIVDIFPCAYGELHAIRNFERIEAFARSKMELFWAEGIESFLNEAENFICCLANKKDTEFKFVMAFSICIWMDCKITYMPDVCRDGIHPYFSLYSLCPCGSSAFSVVESLNTNYKETAIWINPKFPVAMPYVVRGDEKVKKPVANRDIFHGMNGELHNCNYVHYNGNNIINNIILDNTLLEQKEDSTLRIAFVPMTDRKNLLRKEEQIISRSGYPMKGMLFHPIAEAEELCARLERDYELAADIEADVFFAPEMLGSQLSEKNDGIYNDLIYRLSEERLMSGKTVPLLTRLGNKILLIRCPV